MRYVVVGLGNIGGKRRTALGSKCVTTVDPVNPAAEHRTLEACDPETYDAAVLAVPNPVKVEMVRWLLDRGKHALVEKPFIVDAGTVEDLSARAAATGAIWYTSYNFHFEPNVLALKRHIERGTVGAIYRVRMFYGNGTARDHLGTWRDSAFGVLEDMASHLVDMTGFLLGRHGTSFRVWHRRGYELRGIDHAILASEDGTIVIETSFLSYKNRWQIEVVGERGALLMDSLTKWGRSELTVWHRTLPSGAPREERETALGPDPTWVADIAHFEGLCKEQRTSAENDAWVSRVVMAAATMPLGTAT
jgi:predicted dehydrogenase